MKKDYIIVGVKNEGDMVKLVLSIEEPVQEKVGILEMAGNLQKMQVDATRRTQRLQDPDQIRVPYETWETNKWNINDVITIEIQEGK